MDDLNQSKIRLATSPYFIAMIIIEPIVMAYHLAVEGDDHRMSLITSAFLWWSLALVGTAVNCRRWKLLGIRGRFGLIILAVMTLGFAPVVTYVPTVIEVWSIMLGISR